MGIQDAISKLEDLDVTKKTEKKIKKEDVIKTMNRGEGEKSSDFMKRCVPHYIDKGKPQDQAVAICMNTMGISKHDYDRFVEKFPIRKSETEGDFMDRCIMTAKGEGHRDSEALAMCEMLWDDTVKSQEEEKVRESESSLQGGLLKILSP